MWQCKGEHDHLHLKNCCFHSFYDLDSIFGFNSVQNIMSFKNFKGFTFTRLYIHFQICTQNLTQIMKLAKWTREGLQRGHGPLNLPFNFIPPFNSKIIKQVLIYLMTLRIYIKNNYIVIMTYSKAQNVIQVHFNITFYI